MRDDLYLAGQGPIPFAFDQSVANVFADMIRRSVPGYELILQEVANVAKRHLENDGIAYDLGCSLGASAVAMRTGAGKSFNGRIIGIDASQPMIAKARDAIDLALAPEQATQIELECADIREIPLQPCSVVSLGFVLQFLDIADRDQLLERIAKALKPGGVLVLSEKVMIEGPHGEQLRALHEDFKRAAGYSDLEIAGKRQALMNVLMSESLEAHITRLTNAGFSQITPWMQAYSFVSMIAIR